MFIGGVEWETSEHFTYRWPYIDRLEDLGALRAHSGSMLPNQRHPLM